MNPSLPAPDVTWDIAYMSDDGRSPLQNLLAQRVADLPETRDHYDGLLRKKLETTGKPLWDVERGKVQKPSPRVLRAMEEVLGFHAEYLVDFVHPREDGSRRVEAGHASSVPEQPSARTVDGGETAPVIRLDLSYSMGPGTDLDSSYIDGEAFQFDIGFLRGLTVSPPDRLRIVDGVGTSMEPTFHDRDLLLVDINQRDLNAQDRVWACWIFGLGAVKRLRAVGPDRVLVISDNPNVDNQEVRREDILIHGRVVGSIKRH